MEIGPQSLRWRPWYRKGVIPVSDSCVSTRSRVCGKALRMDGAAGGVPGQTVSWSNRFRSHIGECFVDLSLFLRDS